MSLFKIKRKLHPLYPDYIPALKLMGVEADLIQSITYTMHHDTPLVMVRFKQILLPEKRTARAYRWNGNTWVVMGNMTNYV